MAYKYVNDNGLKAYTKKVKGALKDLHTPIAISIENTTESMAQNVKNITDFVAKAKAAGIANVHGMAVTCLIGNDYSGVGYFIGDGTICGVLTTDKLGSADIFAIENGNYRQNGIVMSGIPEQITSSMFTKGARKPIILTSSTTEIDEETYQKLLSDDVDVVFIENEQKFCVPTYRTDNGTILNLSFSAFSCEGDTMEDLYLYGYQVAIAKTGTHSCEITPFNEDEAGITYLLRMAGFPDKQTLSPVLQKIDLTGTDAERKARLAQFETDWKDLTGASDLSGARFVGRIEVSDPDADRNYTGIFTRGFYDGQEREYFSGFICGSSYNKQVIFSAILRPGTGSLTITPLFSHLEPVEIFTDNSAASKQKNLDNINAYKANLENLGVAANDKGTIMPIIVPDEEGLPSVGFLSIGNADFHSGYISSIAGGYYSGISVSNGEVTLTTIVTSDNLEIVNTLAQAVNAFGAIELKASDNAANKVALTAYLKILTDAGVSTTNGYSVPVRITGNAQEYHGMLNIGTGALLSGIVTDVNENHHYPFNVSTADGAITFDANNYFLEKTSNEVTEMLDAIKYSYTPVPLTATTLSNKAQLEVFLSKVPNAQVMHCTYKDVYAGTLHKINGEWFGLLVKNTNNYEDALQVKLQADGTLIEGTTSLAQVNSKLDTIIG